MFFRSAYNHDTDSFSSLFGLSCPPEEGKTQHQFAEDCDINEIVRRFGLTGEMPQNLRMPVSGDFTAVTDFTAAMLAVKEAENEFMRVPADVRARFGNNPAALISFLENVENREEAISLGLIPKPVEKTRDAVQAIDELAAKMVVK